MNRWLLALEHLQRLTTIASRNYLVFPFDQRGFKKAAGNGIIFGDQNLHDGPT